MAATVRLRRYFRHTSWMDIHDDWNLVAIGALNICHIGWWSGLFVTPAALQWLFYADGAYLLMDTVFLLAVPTCVAPRVRFTLLLHHLTSCICLPIAAGTPLLMRHLLRTWVVEVHSWNHIFQTLSNGGQISQHIL